MAAVYFTDAGEESPCCIIVKISIGENSCVFGREVSSAWGGRGGDKSSGHNMCYYAVVLSKGCGGGGGGIRGGEAMIWRFCGGFCSGGGGGGR